MESLKKCFRKIFFQDFLNNSVFGKMQDELGGKKFTEFMEIPNKGEFSISIIINKIQKSYINLLLLNRLVNY